MYDNLWDQSAIIQQMRAASKQEGREEGKVEGETETLQKVIVDTVEVRFPSLLDLAQRKVRTISVPEKLHQLYIQILKAPNEENARALLATEGD
jgi:predicted transposase YdaD